MLQKNKSKQVALVKYGLSAPLFAAMLVLSSATLNKNKFVIRISEKANTVMDAPATVAGELITAEATKEPIALRADTAIKIAEAPLQNDKQLKLKLKSDTVPAGNKTEVFSAVQQMPQPADGLQAFYGYLGRNIRYPAKAKDNKIQGRVVVQFIVEKDGSLSNVSALRGPGYGLDEEAVRVVTASPKWKPGMQAGKPVRTQFVLPVQFSIASAGASSSAATTTSDTERPKSSLGLDEVQVVGYDSRNQPAGSNTVIQVVGTPRGGRSDTSSTKITLKSLQPAPLYILDGKEISEIKNVNPNDIQSIDVIKDKAATKRYGSKGANGAIIVTTRHKP